MKLIGCYYSKTIEYSAPFRLNYINNNLDGSCFEWSDRYGIDIRRTISVWNIVMGGVWWRQCVCDIVIRRCLESLADRLILFFNEAHFPFSNSVSGFGSRSSPYAQLLVGEIAREREREKAPSCVRYLSLKLLNLAASRGYSTNCSFCSIPVLISYTTLPAK